MKESLQLLLLLWMFAVCFLHYGEAAADSNYPDDTCWVDKSLPQSEPKNYQNCQTEDNIKADLTQCCTVGGSIGCCQPNSAQTGRMMKIALGILGVTLGLSILLCALLYCNKRSCPCLIKVEEKWEKMEEDIYCCKDRVKRRKMERRLQERQMDIEKRYQSSATIPPPPKEKRGAITEDDVINDMSLPAPPEFKEKSYAEEWF